VTNTPPMFKWTGSKQRMLAQYEGKFFPPVPVTRYVDLFAGGLTNVLLVAEKYPHADLVFNDFNGELIGLYRDLASNEADVLHTWDECVKQCLSLDTAEQRKAFYYTLREKYTLSHTSYDRYQLSGLLLFMLMVNFNGMWKAYIKCNGRYSTPPGTCLQKAGFFADKREAVKQNAVVLRKATILHGDFGAVGLSAGDFVYADPPYRDSIVDYQAGFTEVDQVRLAKVLTAHSGPYAYSNKDIGDGFFVTNFPSANVHVMSAKYAAGRGTSVLDVKEVLITNY
jgi:DNA adenine methylase